MRWRVVPATAVTVVLVALGACSSPPPPPPAGPQRATCGDVLSISLPEGYTCTPHPTTELASALVDGPRARIVVMASPTLAPGDSATDRPLREGERARPLSINGRSAHAIIVAGGIWESGLEAWVPDAGNGIDRLAVLARWQGEADETLAVAIIESVRVMHAAGTPAAAPAPDAANPPAPATAGPAAPQPAAAPPAPPATPAGTAAPAPVAGADPQSWLRYLVGFQFTVAAPPDMTVTTRDPAEGANVSLNGRTFEAHFYLSEDGVRSVAAQGADTVASEPITVDGPQGMLHRWKRAAGGRPGRPFELELQSRLAPDVHLSVFTSCQTAAACGTAETMLRSIRVIQRP
jgi:hypothetical protein